LNNPVPHGGKVGSPETVHHKKRKTLPVITRWKTQTNRSVKYIQVGGGKKLSRPRNSLQRQPSVVIASHRGIFYKKGGAQSFGGAIYPATGERCIKLQSATRSSSEVDQHRSPARERASNT